MHSSFEATPMDACVCVVGQLFVGILGDEMPKKNYAQLTKDIIQFAIFFSFIVKHGPS